LTGGGGGGVGGSDSESESDEEEESEAEDDEEDVDDDDTEGERRLFESRHSYCSIARSSRVFIDYTETRVYLPLNADWCLFLLLL
jgi:hypothetical protein